MRHERQIERLRRLEAISPSLESASWPLAEASMHCPSRRIPAENTAVAQGGDKRGSEHADRLPTNIIQMKGLFVMGSPMVIHSGREPAIRAPRLEAILAWVKEGRITPFVSHAFPISEYRRAMHAKLVGEVNGGCVLHPD